MAGNNAEATSDINIDTKRSSTAVVREALFRATGEQRWTDDDEWSVFLVKKASHSSFTILTQNYQKQRFIVFSNIAKTNSAKNLEIPQVGKEIGEAFKVQARARIADWAEPMIKYDKAVEWMRRQHWKNNKNKAPLASSSGESTVGISRVADRGLVRLDAAPSAGEAGPGAGTGAGTSSYWANVL